MSSATASSGYLNPFTLLKGISPGVEKPKVEKGTLEKLLEVYEKVKEECRDVVAVEDKLKLLLSEINYCEKDISNLVATAQTWDLDENESKAFGAYVGSLISILTERNEAKGKRTIIEISENHLDYLGYYCRKFDVVKFGVNNGDHVFYLAKDGNELYVERCEGDDFASDAGRGGHVGEIKANIVDGKKFAESAGSDGGHVVEIRANTVNGEGFAFGAGFGGYVGEISADTVNGDEFANLAGWEKGCVGEISAGSVNGNGFARHAGLKGGYVGEIRADNVNGEGFAAGAGSENGRVDKISADVVKGKEFASYAGWKGGYVGEISAVVVVKGEGFAENAGSENGHVGKISAGTVNGDEFASFAGSGGGHVGEISAGSVNGNEFARYAGLDGGHVGKIRAGSVNGLYFALGAARGDEISADTVNGKFFAFDAVAEKIYVRKISEEAKATMNPKTIVGDWEVEK
jgi:hypothetical protein